jgi:ectoine hydroxylase-related dioxygenase (phytanoyl-CoA dioxygenase family)
MLGTNQLVEPQGIRGIYCTLPYGEHPIPPLTCHCDAHPFHLGVVGYIDDVPPGGGGFTVWPGSHLKFYYAYDSQYRNEQTPEYDIWRQYYNAQQPVDCYGEAGDIVFWHHRLAHVASPNSSKQIRQAVLYDYKKTDIEKTQEEKPQQDMWRDWSEELRDIG